MHCCDCRGGQKRLSARWISAVPLPTEVNADGVCIHCGHFAVWEAPKIKKTARQIKQERDGFNASIFDETEYHKG